MLQCYTIFNILYIITTIVLSIYFIIRTIVRKNNQLARVYDFSVTCVTL